MRTSMKRPNTPQSVFRTLSAQGLAFKRAPLSPVKAPLFIAFCSRTDANPNNKGVQTKPIIKEEDDGIPQPDNATLDESGRSGTKECFNSQQESRGGRGGKTGEGGTRGNSEGWS